MKISGAILDTDNMSIKEVDALIKQLKEIRARKGEARSRRQQLRSMLINMKEDGYIFCSHYTGEVLNANDWDIYDEIEKVTYSNEVDE